MYSSYSLIALLACGIAVIAAASPPSPSAVIVVSVTLDAPPTADTIVPDTTGPTTSSTVTFFVTFSEDVMSFNDASDVLISETDTVTHTDVGIVGGPRIYTVEIAGVTGDGTMTLAVNTASDVQDAAGNRLASSVTSSPVTIGTTQQVPLVYWPVALLLSAVAMLALRRAKVER